MKAPSLLGAATFATLALGFVPHSQASPTGPSDLVPTHVLAYVEEPSSEPGDPGSPLRYATPVAVSLDLWNEGRHGRNPDGDTVVRMRFASPGARALGLVFSELALDGGELRIQGEIEEQVVRPERERPDGRFVVAPLVGEQLTLEYHGARHSRPRLVTETVLHGWIDFSSDELWSRANPCNVDVRCPLGDDWVVEKQSVAMILSTFGALCTGSLINNAEYDGRQLFLTADHCLDGNEADWVFMFNYERKFCRAGASPREFTVQGAELLGSAIISDWAVLEILEPIPEEFDAHFAGWDHRGRHPQQAYGIHHGGGKPKKIAHEDERLSQNAQMWEVSGFREGSIEGGASGSPLFDPNRRVVGQLSSGGTGCGPATAKTRYGQMHRAWDQKRAWLDPHGQSVGFIDGVDASDLPLALPLLTDKRVAYEEGTMTFVSYKGMPDRPVLLGIVGGLGIPSMDFVRVTLDVTGPDGVWVFMPTVPRTIAGQTLSFQAFGYDRDGLLSASNVVDVEFLPAQ